MPLCSESDELESRSADQLFLLEVLVDQILVDNDDSWTSRYPLLPLAGKISFLGLPDMEIEPNDLAPKDNEEVSQDAPVIPNLPDGWTVSEATDLADYDKFPQYRVTLFVVNRVTEKSFIVTILVPKIAVLVGEGLRYIYTALERKVSPELLDEIKGQIKEKLEKDNENKTDGSEEKPKPVQFSAGKSCLFEMPPDELMVALKKFPLYVMIYRCGSIEGIPVNHLVGKVLIPVETEFRKAIIQAATSQVLPVSAHLEEIFAMKNIFGVETGTIGLFVRLSCYGRSVLRPAVCGPKVVIEDKVVGKQVMKRQAMLALEEETLKGRVQILGPAQDDGRRVMWRRICDPLPCPVNVTPAYLIGRTREMPPPPPRPEPPPPEMADLLPGLPRCGPKVKPPCFRRPWDAPLSKCDKLAEEQLQREERTKGVQTSSEEVQRIGRVGVK